MGVARRRRRRPPSRKNGNTARWGNRANAAPQVPPERSRTPARTATPKAVPKPAPKAMGPPAPKRHGKEQRTGKR
eukprot:gene24308-biopygen22383